MLEIGNGGQSVIQSRTHFSFWAGLKSPLMMGHDLTRMSNDTFDILANEEVIAISQDPLGKSISLVLRDEFFDVWTGPLSEGDWVICELFSNRFLVHTNTIFDSTLQQKIHCERLQTIT